eukprot:gene24054-biopygen16388
MLPPRSEREEVVGQANFGFSYLQTGRVGGWNLVVVCTLGTSKARLTLTFKGVMSNTETYRLGGAPGRAYPAACIHCWCHGAPLRGLTAPFSYVLHRTCVGTWEMMIHVEDFGNREVREKLGHGRGNEHKWGRKGDSPEMAELIMRQFSA